MKRILYIGIVRLNFYELLPSISLSEHGLAFAWLNRAIVFQWEKEEEK